MTGSSGVSMIAFGTVMGGAGSALTGGNFWQGAVTGLMVAGLNHGMHMIEERNELIKMLETAGYKKPDWIADFNGLSLEEFAAKVFPELYSSAKKPGFEKVKEIKAEENGKIVEADGLVWGHYDKVNGSYKLSSIDNIKIAKYAFGSYLRLAQTVGHELHHYVDHISGIYGGWANSRDFDYAHNMSESKAWSWSFSVNPTYENQYWMNSYQKKL